MSLHASHRGHSGLAPLDRRSSPYDDDPMVRLTGLSLDPDFPPHHQHTHSSSSQHSATAHDSDYEPQPQQRGTGAGASPTRGGYSGSSTSPERPRSAAGNDRRAPSRQSNDRPVDDRDEGHEDVEDDHHHHGHEHDEDEITLRALVTSREAGVIIGKAGKNVAEVRDKAGVKAGVSKVVQGIHERILTVSGPLQNVAKAYGIVARHLLENPTSTIPPAHPDCTTVRLLVAHQLMGSVIGKAGSRIREIQDESGAKIVVSKEMLPQSTERVIDIYGLADSIQIAVAQIGECVLTDYERAAGTIPYTPQPRSNAIRTGGYRHDDAPYGGGAGRERRRSSVTEATGPNGTAPVRRYSRSGPNGAAPSSATSRSTAAAPGDDVEPQTLAIPADMIGCIIGKGGSFINQIRRLSGARLRIDEIQEGQTERVVSISGTEAQTKKALSLLYNQLESEKQRRAAGGHGGRDGAEFEGEDM
ncbi:RNA binding protein, heterogenous nuclear RNP-K like protein [Borealophlyctis nickersoniae]|nr:RNA binding protein, heterogenous nuclear RNP-K like protein [Borealophlyctis nickersoniae]